MAPSCSPGRWWNSVTWAGMKFRSGGKCRRLRPSKNPNDTSSMASVRMSGAASWLTVPDDQGRGLVASELQRAPHLAQLRDGGVGGLLRGEVFGRVAGHLGLQ